MTNWGLKKEKGEGDVGSIKHPTNQEGKEEQDQKLAGQRLQGTAKHLGAKGSKEEKFYSL